MPEHVEGDRYPVAVGIGNRRRLQDAVVAGGRRGVPDRVGDGGRQQRVAVPVGTRNGAERIHCAPRRKESRERGGEFGGRRVGVACGVEHPAGRLPPAGLPGQLHVTALGQGGRGHERAEDRRQQARRQRRLVGLPRQRARLQLTERQQRGQVVAAVAHPLPRDEPAGRRGRRRPRAVDVRAGDLLVRHVVRPGPHRRPEASGPVDLVEGEQVGDPRSLDRRGDAGDLGFVDGRRQRHPVGVRPGGQVIDRVGVTALGPPDVQPRPGRRPASPGS